MKITESQLRNIISKTIKESLVEDDKKYSFQKAKNVENLLAKSYTSFEDYRNTLFNLYKEILPFIKDNDRLVRYINEITKYSDDTKNLLDIFYHSVKINFAEMPHNDIENRFQGYNTDNV